MGGEVGTHIIRLIGRRLRSIPRLKSSSVIWAKACPSSRPDRQSLFLGARDGGRAAALKRKPSDYIRENIVVTTSGMNYTGRCC